MTSVQNLLKKHALVEADVNSHQDRVDGVKIASEQFCTAGHFDSKNIQAKHAGKLKFSITNNTSYKSWFDKVWHHHGSATPNFLRNYIFLRKMGIVYLR